MIRVDVIVQDRDGSGSYPIPAIEQPYPRGQSIEEFLVSPVARKIREISLRDDNTLDFLRITPFDGGYKVEIGVIGDEQASRDIPRELFSHLNWLCSDG